MKAILLSIGDELILGQTVDTNAAWLSQRCAALGVKVIEHATIGDDLNLIAATLRRVGGNCDVILASGGLGPTDDDLTRHALAEVLGVELEFNKSAMSRIQAFYDLLKRPMPEANHIQAMIPVGCEVMENTCGTAPGISARIGRAQAFFMPGVPREMFVMFTKCIEQRLQNAGGNVLVTRVLHTCGAGESNIAEMLGDMMVRGRNPLVNSTAQQGLVSLRINAQAPTELAAREMIAPVETALRNRLGKLVFGADEETLSSVVVERLMEMKASLATAESCTGGWIARELTDIAGVSAVYLGGWVVYNNQAKVRDLNVDATVLNQEGAVSEPVARQLAENACKRAGADYAIGVTGIAGPTGGTTQKPVGTVYIAIAGGGSTQVERFIFPGDRDGVRRRTVNYALNLLRLRLIE
ncbi:MAG: competence/damage-inducible protein A [Sedimentisphaerales bacterium]|nr:competence/damage-inducible protein A [Sedimentisphaerales bacterium]